MQICLCLMDQLTLVENAICIHEEDYGIQWKHTDTNKMGANEVRRSRRLVISSIATIGNYDYGLFCIYISMVRFNEVKLTGIVGISSYDESIHEMTKISEYPMNVSPYSPKYLFCIRLVRI